jgi:hypothetical protein
MIVCLVLLRERVWWKRAYNGNDHFRMWLAWFLQVAVAVFHRMSTAKHGDKAVAAQEFARALHDRWGVGNPDCQNGALLLLAVGDKQVRDHQRHPQALHYSNAQTLEL